MFRSIRWRLVLSFALLTVLTVTAVGVLALSLVKRYAEEQEAAYLTANARAVAQQALPLVWPMVHYPELQELVQTSSFLGNARVRILNSQQQVLADSGVHVSRDEVLWVLAPQIIPQVEEHLPDGQHFTIFLLPHGEVVHGDPSLISAQFLSQTRVTIAHRWDGVWGSRFTFDSDQGVHEELPVLPFPSDRVVIVPIGDEVESLGYVEIGSGSDLTEAFATIGRALLLAGAGAMSLAIIAGLLVSRGLTAPISELTRTAEQMGSGDLSIRASVRGKSEIGRLADQFNRMAEQLETSFSMLAAERDTLRRFIADASHELRTPITALRNFNELLQGVAEEDPSARAEFLAESQVQIDRLEWITHNLLDLSRLDAGLAALEIGDHTVRELLEAVTAAFRAPAREKRISLSIQPPEPSFNVRCDRRRIEMALANLVDNAIKFTPAGGQVEVGADQAEGTVRLWVRDDGLGIDPADQPHIFERFYRGRVAHAKGSGLGLAIVQGIARAHDGVVSVESAPEAGSLFVIELSQG